ncbi:ribonuclease P protein component 4 [Thermofilum pendens]|uniref:Ribonuclease P protein component 4 n=1 Tax=Thermofilum pendens (strain DSM 2475 / Hrk 5) TaxID=368408 RepID=A1RXN6_THEPD|nr:RNAse P, Rpr2/Rpp21 subunit [Thermofilum pendens]ABL77966.1 RNAse P, Rpr2/Rpp21 subunit [Thermofilum pendens Hrk 5]
MKRDEREIRDLARQRIKRLLEFAAKVYRVEPRLADRYGELSLLIAKKARLHYPDFLKARVCRKCGAFLVVGFSARVRVKNRGKMKYIAVTCLRCGYTRRYPLKRSAVPPKPWYVLYGEVAGHD